MRLIFEGHQAHNFDQLEVQKLQLQHKEELANLREEMQQEFKAKLQLVIESVSDVQFDQVDKVQSKLAILRKQKEDAERAQQLMEVRLDQSMGDLKQIKVERDEYQV